MAKRSVSKWGQQQTYRWRISQMRYRLEQIGDRRGARRGERDQAGDQGISDQRAMAAVVAAGISPTAAITEFESGPFDSSGF
jgi:hypothetical protein